MDEKMGLSHQIMLYNREKGNLTGTSGFAPRLRRM